MTGVWIFATGLAFLSYFVWLVWNVIHAPFDTDLWNEDDTPNDMR